MLSTPYVVTLLYEHLTSSGGNIAFLEPPTRIPSPADTVCMARDYLILDNKHAEVITAQLRMHVC